MHSRYIAISVLFSILSTVVRAQERTAFQNRQPDTPEAARGLIPDSVVLTIPLTPGQTPLSVTLKQLMEIFKVPGVSVAIIDRYKIVWARGYGVTASGGNTPVTARTLFQAASISKPITAVGALCLVEQGKLGLDEDVNSRLKSWKVPESEFTATRKVTLRRIMSHSAGFNVHGF